MHLRTFTIAAALGVAAQFLSVTPAVGQITQQGQKESKLSAADQKLMNQFGQGNLAEIETGTLAQRKGASEEIKAFGAHMVDDHGKTLKKLQALASTKGLELPTKPDSKQQASAKSLAQLNQPAFDQRYIAMAVGDHKKTLQLLEKIERSTLDADFKQLAQEAKPIVAGHLAQAEKMAAASTGTKSGATAGK